MRRAVDVLAEAISDAIRSMTQLVVGLLSFALRPVVDRNFGLWTFMAVESVQELRHGRANVVIEVRDGSGTPAFLHMPKPVARDLALRLVAELAAGRLSTD